MKVLIINKSDLSFLQIGRLIDDMNSRVETNYIGKKDYYKIKINAKMYKVETEIQKTQFKMTIVEDNNE